MLKKWSHMMLRSFGDRFEVDVEEDRVIIRDMGQVSEPVFEIKNDVWDDIQRHVIVTREGYELLGPNDEGN